MERVLIPPLGQLHRLLQNVLHHLVGRCLLLPLGSLVASPVPEGARGVGAVDDGDPRVEARLLFDHSVATAGGKLRAGVYFELDRGWHIYWRNPGESGLPTQLDWQVEAAQVGPVQLPGPEVFTEGGLTTYGYSGRCCSRAT